MLVKSKFKPAWWMTHRHLQTIIPRIYSIKSLFKPAVQDFELSDGDFVEVTWSHQVNKIKPDQPIVLLFHGLEGSFDSFYTKRMMNAIYQQGWVAVLMHFRGCGAKTNRKTQTYHSGQTSDVSEFIDYLKQRHPTNPLFSIGFSLGGNVLAKYAGEREDSKLDGAIVISAPFNLSECTKAVNRGFAKVYQKYLLDKLKRSTSEKIEHLNGSDPKLLDQKTLDNIKNMVDFDRLVTAPLNGFVDANDYYQQSSGKQFLSTINTPTLVIHSADDPFMNESVIPNESELSPSVEFELSKKGGHVGFLAGNNPLKPEFWLETRSIAFIKSLLTEKK